MEKPPHSAVCRDVPQWGPRPRTRKSLLVAVNLLEALAGPDSIQRKFELRSRDEIGAGLGDLGAACGGMREDGAGSGGESEWRPSPSPSVVNCFGTPSGAAPSRGWVFCERGELAGQVGAGWCLRVAGAGGTGSVAQAGWRGRRLGLCATGLPGRGRIRRGLRLHRTSSAATGWRGWPGRRRPGAGRGGRRLRWRGRLSSVPDDRPLKSPRRVGRSGRASWQAAGRFAPRWRGERGS